MIVRESLGIYWLTQEGNTAHHEEVDGLSFYAYWPEGSYPPLNLQVFKEGWGEASIEVKSSELEIIEGERQASLIVDVKINSWPESYWDSCIESSLDFFLQLGAKVAWCGDELCTPNLEVFSSEGGSGEVYAVKTSPTGFLCNASLDEDMLYLHVRQLELVQSAINAD